MTDNSGGLFILSSGVSNIQFKKITLKGDTKKPPKLLDQVRAYLRVKHYSPKTEEAYINWIKRFIYFHNKRHPKEMGSEEIREFISHLANKKRVSSATQNQALQGVLFLYKNILNKDVGW
ncbi:MAG TPA: phage integrase N-terminal SAM-like domain-containing protein, partial [Ignavibacteriaceae bacterium]|nr:phage integrase N-terminal SAM-like domain-containing protein [Ignavibacteriaceae bacterium]